MMSHTSLHETRKHGEPDSSVDLHSLMKAPPTSREAHTERMTRRGEVRRKVEDLLLSKQHDDLW